MGHDKTSWAPVDIAGNLMLPSLPKAPAITSNPSGVPSWFANHVREFEAYQKNIADYHQRMQSAIQNMQTQNARAMRLLASWVIYNSPRCHLTKTSGDVQDVGGVNGNITYITWDSQIELGANFTHDTVTNSNQIQCDFDGRVHVKASISAEQTGAGRTTLGIYARANGSTVKKLGKHRNYSRGSSYGDISLIYDSEFDVSDGDYLEIAVIVDDTDAIYTINTFYDECEIIVTRIG